MRIESDAGTTEDSGDPFSANLTEPLLIRSNDHGKKYGYQEDK